VAEPRTRTDRADRPQPGVPGKCTEANDHLCPTGQRQLRDEVRQARVALGRIPLSRRGANWGAVLFGFGTIFWYHATIGSVWYLAHRAHAFFMWLAIAEWLRKARPMLIGLAVAAAVWCRMETSLEELGGLKPDFKADGMGTAGNSWQISDGAASDLIMERGTAERLGLRPRARCVSCSVAGDNPVLMLTAPIPATYKALDRAGLTLDQIDRVEINEAFAPVVLAWQKELDPDMRRVNVNGGAIALGHPLGATGARLMTTLLHDLERNHLRFGLLGIPCVPDRGEHFASRGILPSRAGL